MGKFAALLWRAVAEVPIAIPLVGFLEEEFRTVKREQWYARRSFDKCAREELQLDALRREHLLLAAPARIGDMDIVDDQPRRRTPVELDGPANGDGAADQRASRMLDHPSYRRTAAEIKREYQHA